MGISESHLIY